MLVLPAAPHRKPHTRRGKRLRVPAERQPEDVDDPLVGGAADVGVRRHREAHVHVPSPARPDPGKEPLDIGDHRIRRVAGQHAFEVLLGQAVLSFVEEGPGQLQPHAHQTGLVDEHGAKGRYGFIQERFAVSSGNTPLLRVLQRRQSL